MTARMQDTGRKTQGRTPASAQPRAARRVWKHHRPEVESSGVRGEERRSEL